MRLWNALDATIGRHDSLYAGWVEAVWTNILARPRDDLRHRWLDFRQAFMTAPWNTMYEIVEFAGQSVIQGDLQAALELGGSGYRFVDDQLVPITDEEQIAEIETARKRTETGPLANVRKHLDQALMLLADRENPDHRNSMKEAISAVECLVNAINVKPGTLGAAIKRLNDSGANIHPAMIAAFDKLYGYTSDAGGIRHALKDEITPGADEARFLLVTVSAFVNLVIAKCSAVGIALK